MVRSTLISTCGALALVFALVQTGCGGDDGLKIKKVSPHQGDFSGGETVTIHGSGFKDKGAKVYFGNKAAKVLRIEGSTEIKVQAPGGEAGKEVDITIVFEAEGSKTLEKAYKYIEATGLGVGELTEGEKAVQKRKREEAEKAAAEKKKKENGE